MANLLSDQLTKSFSVNWKGEKFISFRQLDNLLSEATVTHIVQQTSIPPYERKDAQRAILPGGKRVFATLCSIQRPHLLMDFIAQDGFLGSHSQLDFQLPFEEEVLKKIIPDDYRAFYDTQWTFCSPLFEPNLSHRKLDKRCILPFLKFCERGQGAFGKAFEIELPGLHQKFADSITDTVRTELQRL